jgi:hypothetical protein
MFARSLLKLGNVEDRVNSRFSRQVELIGNDSHFLKHCKGPKELEGELLVRTRRQRRLHVWLQLEVD